jgi:alanine racemase
MSHLVASEERDNPLNPQQLERFRRLRQLFPPLPASLVNSSGIFLGSDYHFDLVRPGVALYGGNPLPGRPNPMAQVVHLQGRILQVHRVDTPRTVGYGATHLTSGPARIATVGVGYADGYPRSLGNRGYAGIGAVRVPVIGRVSMDLITLDVSALAPAEAAPGTLVDLIGGGVDIDALADLAGTNAYELLTRLGPRYRRIYHSAIPGASGGAAGA